MLTYQALHTSGAEARRLCCNSYTNSCCSSQLSQDFVSWPKASLSLHLTTKTMNIWCKTPLEHILQLLLFTLHPQFSLFSSSLLRTSNLTRYGGTGCPKKRQMLQYLTTLIGKNFFFISAKRYICICQ